MGGVEGMHGDWQHMTGDEVEDALRAGGEALEAAGDAGEIAAEAGEIAAEAGEVADEEMFAGEGIALAIGGEAAVELEVTAPVDSSIVVLDPASEAERDTMRRGTSRGMDRPHVSIYHLEPGPDGHYITGSPGA